MAVNLAGSASNVQQTLNVVRQTIQADQIASAVAVEASSQAAKTTVQDSAATVPVDTSRGTALDVKA